MEHLTQRHQAHLYPVGVIHGRFKVLHSDHLAYIKSGKALCAYLVVAVT